MNDAALAALAALSTTSVLVRIVPAFVRLSLSERGLHLVGQVMPMAVFINLAVYVIYSEIGRSPLAGGLALMVVAVLALKGRIGLMGSTLLAAAIYYLLGSYLP
ncbi:hypothetical protein [Pseudomonas songnenensis]|jgi:hypothetical protein|uniref:Uncharacterized protein n=1 Tax=Pseudomonas songnenensis TaxID=1176259 RepID=A0A482UDS9_9PSED|nr:hypothetical protein [Pseudomonas songnenensis]RYJ63527.1 hypothetical protein EJA06_006185 [Pseudomonas songnenensis]